MKIKLQITAFAALIALSGTVSANWVDGMSDGGGNGQANGSGNGQSTGNGNMTGAGNGDANGFGKGQGNADGEVDFTITIKGKGRSDMVSDLFAQGNASHAGMMDGNTMGAANAAGNGNGNGSNSASGNGSQNSWGNNNSGGAYPMMPMRAPAPIMMQQAAPAAGVYPTAEQWQQFLAVQKARQQAFAEIVRAMYSNKPAQKMAVPVSTPKVTVSTPAPAPKAAVVAPK